MAKSVDENQKNEILDMLEIVHKLIQGDDSKYNTKTYKKFNTESSLIINDC